jgi:tetratricopeptide (TPR) repeat protein
LADETTDAISIMNAIEGKAEEFRENILLRELLSQLPQECRRMIALASVYELPFDRQSIAVAVDNSLDPHLARAVSLGLMEGGIAPATGQSRYFVSRLMVPLMETETTAEEMTEAARRAANHLYQTLWLSGSISHYEEELEIFRLGLAAQEHAIAADSGAHIAWRWMHSSRYCEAEAICLAALRLGEDYRLLQALARAQFVLGGTSVALQNYERALSLCPESDVNSQSSILFNLAALVAQQGDVNGALDLWQQSLALAEQIGNVQGKATILQNMVEVVAQQGDVKRALDLLQQSLAVYEQIGDVEGKAATLHVMARIVGQQGDVTRALDLWQQSLTLKEQVGDIRGTAGTLHEVSTLIMRQGDVKRALDLLQQALAIYEQIGDARGKATTLHSIAVVMAQQGDVNGALDLWQQSLALSEQIGDAQGKAGTLHQMAGVIVDQGDTERALDLLQHSLGLTEQIGDAKSQATALNCMAVVMAQQGDVNGALDLWQQSLALSEQIGDVQGKAATLQNMACLAWEQGETEKARRLFLESAKAMATARAWLDLVKVLINLGSGDSDDTSVFLAQALWLALRIAVPVTDSLNLTAGILTKIGVEHNIAPLLGTAALFFARTRGQHHTDQKSLVQYAINMLGACAKARGIEQQDQFERWFAKEGLNDPSQVLPTLSHALEAMVGEEGWLFDRRLVGAI